LAILAVAALTATGLANSYDYEYTLTGDGGGLTGQGSWNNANTSMYWWAKDNGDDWTYSYTLSVNDDPDISHFILNLSDDLPLGTEGVTTFEISMSYLDEEEGFEFDLYEPSNGNGNGKGGGSNPGLPQSFFGVKGDTDGDPESITLTITTTRMPMLGSFYAKGAQQGIWNEGLESQDDIDLYDFSDPTVFAGYLLVPDSDDVPGPPPPGVPEPMTALAFVGAAGGLSGYLRKRRRDR
jgi:hypothetical protein